MKKYLKFFKKREKYLEKRIIEEYYNKDHLEKNDSAIIAANYVYSFFKYVVVGVFMWIATTLTLKYGLKLGFDIWVLTAFNVVFYGILKYIIYLGLEVFEIE